MDGVAVEVRVTRGIGDLRRVNIAERFIHSFDYVRNLALGIEIEHCGYSLGNGLCGNDHNGLILAQRDALLGGHDDVLVVGQNKHDLRRSAVYLFYYIRR